MTDTQLIKLEKEIEKKLTITSSVNKDKKFIIDVTKLKQLAKRINEYESKSNATAQH